MEAESITDFVHTDFVVPVAHFAGRATVGARYWAVVVPSVPVAVVGGGGPRAGKCSMVGCRWRPFDASCADEPLGAPKGTPLLGHRRLLTDFL